MARTSAKVRNRWNKRNYDRVTATIPKGYVEKLKEFCASQGESMNAVVTRRMRFEIEEFKSIE